MYSTEQYMAPTGPYDTVETIDGSSWYRQYACLLYTSDAADE